MYHSSNIYDVSFLFYCVMQIHGLNLVFEVHASKRRLRWKKKKQYATCALDSTSPKEGEACGWIGVSYEPICHCFKSIFWANKFLLLFLIPGKPCWFCCINLSVLQFVGSLNCVWQ